MLIDNINNAALDAIKACSHTEAESLFEQALTLDPNHVETVYNYGLFRWRRGQQYSGQLVDTLSEIFKQDPFNSNIPYLIGCIEREAFNFNEATKRFNEAKQLGCSERDLDCQIFEIETRSGIEQKILFEYRLDNRKINYHSPISCRGNKIALANQDGAICIMDADDGHEISRINLCLENIHDIALSPDGQLLAIIAGHKIYIWDLQEELNFFDRPIDKFKRIKPIDGFFPDPIRDVKPHPKLTFSPDGERILCCRYLFEEIVERPPYDLYFTHLNIYEFKTSTCERLNDTYLDRIHQGDISAPTTLIYGDSSEEWIWIKAKHDISDETRIGIRTSNSTYDWKINRREVLKGLDANRRNELFYSSDVDYAILLPAYFATRNYDTALGLFNTTLRLFRASSGESVLDMMASHLYQTKDCLNVCVLDDDEGNVIRAISPVPCTIKQAPWCICGSDAPKLWPAVH